MSKDIFCKYINKFAEADGAEDTLYEPFDKIRFLKDNLPLFECDDREIEEIYYFRAYTFLKHIKKSSDGKLIITEFSYPGWGKKTEGAISCASGHYFKELRWFKNSTKIAEDSIDFWCNRIEDLWAYSNWFIYAVYDYLNVTGEWEIVAPYTGKLIEAFERLVELHQAKCGLYKSVDNFDGMELSISSYGIRPTINSYVYGNAYGLYKILEHWHDGRALQYKEFCKKLKERINHELFKEDFYYTLPLEYGEDMPRYLPDFSNPHPKWFVKELSGYVPFYFNIGTKQTAVAFKYLTDENVFNEKYGLATVDRSDKQYRYPFKHVCLWNGPVWPYATSQTLTGLINAVKSNIVDQSYNAVFEEQLHKYAASQYIVLNGVKRPWIDECLDGRTCEWETRKLLYYYNIKEKDRGKDYNHSSYIDLVISGLCGVTAENQTIKAQPILNKTKHFTLKNITICKKTYNVSYTQKDGVKIEEI